MIKKFFIPLLFAVSLFASDSNDTLVWPSPPDEPRIMFDKFVSKAEDLKIKKGFFTKVLDFLLGREEKVLANPFGLHVSSDGRLFVADAGNAALFIFDAAGNEMNVIEGGENEKLAYPVDVVTDANGSIYLSDSVLGMVFKYDKNFKLVYTFGEKQKFSRPTGIAVDNERRLLYVVDTLDNKINVFSLDGEWIREIGRQGRGKGEFNRPTFVAIGKNGNIHVADSMNQRVQILDVNGSFLRSFGQMGSEIGSFASPRGIALDDEENIYVTDTLFNVVQIFNQKGELLLVFGGFGQDRGQFSIPKDIAIDKRGNIFIADSYNMRVQVLKRIKTTHEEAQP